ncbi:MAG TPA: hypothetical protein VGB63_16110 [Pedobacter sp.]|jgi:DNA-dependent RNA polymerase auxiliary subunit epsilon
MENLEPLNHNDGEISKLQETIHSLCECLRYNIDPQEYLTYLNGRIIDLEGQIDLFEFSQDKDRLVTAQSVLNSVYKCKSLYLEIAMAAQKRQNTLLLEKVLDFNKDEKCDLA